MATNVNGVVVIDKPEGKTSHTVVQEVKRILNVKKAGHTGTLDPLATGVLPVCINEATKLVQFLSMDSKEYRVVMRLGLRTDTYDIQGKVLTLREPAVSGQDIEEILRTFVGRREQTPPRFSAIKFRGKAFYVWARKGIEIEPPKRWVEIYDISLTNVELPHVVFTVSCSKGTYVRSLCAEVGEMLGCGACLAGLRRLRSGNFSEASAVSLSTDNTEDIREILLKKMIPMSEVLSNVPAIVVDEELAEKLKNGYQPRCNDVRTYHIPFLDRGDMIKFIDSYANLVAISEMLYPSDQIMSLDGRTQVMKIQRVFRTGQ